MDGQIFHQHCSETAFKCHLVVGAETLTVPMPNQLTGPRLVFFFQEQSQSWGPLGSRQRHKLPWDGSAWEAEHGWVCSGANKEDRGEIQQYLTGFLFFFFPSGIGRAHGLSFIQDTLEFQ